MGEERAKSSFIPLNGRVLIEPFELEDMTEGGLYIPDSAKEVAIDGLVRAVAKSCKEDIPIGCQAMYRKYGGTKVELNDREYVCIPETDILGIIEK